MAENDQEDLTYKEIWHIVDLSVAKFADLAEVTRPTLAYLETLLKFGSRQTLQASRQSPASIWNAAFASCFKKMTPASESVSTVQAQNKTDRTQSRTGQEYRYR